MDVCRPLRWSAFARINIWNVCCCVWLEMYTWSKRDAIWVNQEVGFKLVKKSVCLVRYSYVLGEYEDYSGREVEVSST